MVSSRNENGAVDMYVDFSDGVAGVQSAGEPACNGFSHVIRFLHFGEAHRDVLNAILRQNIDALLDGPSFSTCLHSSYIGF